MIFDHRIFYRNESVLLLTWVKTEDGKFESWYCYNPETTNIYPLGSDGFVRKRLNVDLKLCPKLGTQLSAKRRLNLGVQPWIIEQMIERRLLEVEVLARARRKFSCA